MRKVKTKVSYQRVWKLIQRTDRFSGLFLLSDFCEKKTFMELIFRLTRFRYVLMFSICMISTLIITNFTLISVIFCASVGSMAFALFVTMKVIELNRIIFKDVFKWCKSLYDVENKYHKVVRETATNHLVLIEKRAWKVVKWLNVLLFADAFGFTVGFAIIGIFLPEHIYPKFSPPMPFYFPFTNQKSWFAFIGTVLLLMIISVDTSLFAIYTNGCFLYKLIHILGYLDIIIETTLKMKQQMHIKNLKKNEIISLEEWSKILTSMISDVNDIISKCRIIYNIPILLLEMASFASLFICGLIFTIIKQQYFFGIGITIVAILLLAHCYVNEKILEKFDDIKKILYDLPWYEMDSKKMKTLCFMMNCDQIQKGFTAAGIHNITFERFGKVVKAGYTNMLVLKDLVQK